MKYIFSLPILIVLLFTVSTIRAQTVVSTSDPDLMQRAEMVSEIKSLRAQNSAKDTIIAEQKSSIATYEKLNAVQESRIADLKDSIKNRTDATAIDARIDAVRLQQIADYREENLRLRDENAKLRKSRDRRSLIFGVAGLIAGGFLL